MQLQMEDYRLLSGNDRDVIRGSLLNFPESFFDLNHVQFL